MIYCHDSYLNILSSWTCWTIFTKIIAKCEHACYFLKFGMMVVKICFLTHTIDHTKIFLKTSFLRIIIFWTKQPLYQINIFNHITHLIMTIYFIHYFIDVRSLMHKIYPLLDGLLAKSRFLHLELVKTWDHVTCNRL